MKDISSKIEEISMKLSQAEDPQKIIKDMKITEREKYLISGRALKILMFLLLQFYNVMKMGEIFKEEEQLK